jgi:hypothetical protein
MKQKIDIKARKWDRKSGIGIHDAAEILKRRPRYKDKDVVVLTVNGVDHNVFTVDELKKQLPPSCKIEGVNTEKIADMYIKHRIASVNEQLETIEFRESGYLVAMAEMMGLIVDLQERIKQLEQR